MRLEVAEEEEEEEERGEFEATRITGLFAVFV